MPNHVVAIIQARMASSRLPGKVLLEISGRPMLELVHARTARARRVDQVIVATTTDASDDAVAAYCPAHGMEHTRGSQFDVLDRYYQAASRAHADVVVRVTADCPVIDAALIDQAVEVLLGGGFDFVANRLPPPFHRTYPIGLDVEVCTFTALEHSWADGQAPVHREHVMPYLYEGVELVAQAPMLSAGTSPRGFKIGLLNHDPDLGELRWTVDTHEDLEFVREVYRRLGDRDDFSWKEVLDLVQRDPALAQINAGIRHKTLTDVDDRASKQ